MQTLYCQLSAREAPKKLQDGWTSILSATIAQHFPVQLGNSRDPQQFHVAFDFCFQILQRPFNTLLSGCGQRIEIHTTPGTGRSTGGDRFQYMRSLANTTIEDDIKLTDKLIAEIAKAAKRLAKFAELKNISILKTSPTSLKKRIENTL